MVAKRSLAPFLGSTLVAAIAFLWLLVAAFVTPNLEDYPLLALPLGVVPVLYVLAFRAGWRRKQTRLNDDVEQVVAEGRPYMLYLRPFVTAGRLQVPNDWPHFGQRVLLGDPWDIELALATIAGSDTPLIAIGDTRGSFGAAKVLSSDADWQQKMLRLARNSKLILAVPLDRPSTLWEMEVVNSDASLRDKTLFIMPPSSRFYDFVFFFFRKSVAARWRNSAKALRKGGLVLPPYNHRGGFFLMGPDRNPSKLAGFRYFRRDYVNGMLMQLSSGGMSSEDRIARFDAAYGGARWLRPRLFGQLSLMGWLTPSAFKTTALTGIAFLLATGLFYEQRLVPSESMVPTLEVTDRVSVSKFAYGYSKYSLPLSLGRHLPIGGGRIFSKLPDRGEIVVFEHPHSERVMINRVIGLPGDTVQILNETLVLNGEPVQSQLARSVRYVPDHEVVVETVEEWNETIGDRTWTTHRGLRGRPVPDTLLFIVPEGHVFMIGDNRNNSYDSRELSGHCPPNNGVVDRADCWLRGDPQDASSGFVPLDHLIGRAETVLFTSHRCKLLDEQACPVRAWKAL